MDLVSWTIPQLTQLKVQFLLERCKVFFKVLQVFPDAPLAQSLYNEPLALLWQLTMVSDFNVLINVGESNTAFSLQKGALR